MKKETEDRFMSLTKKEMPKVPKETDKSTAACPPLALIKVELEKKKTEGALALKKQEAENKLL